MAGESEELSKIKGLETSPVVDKIPLGDAGIELSASLSTYDEIKMST